MSEMERTVLGNIWRICDQMAYAAEHGYTETLKVQFDALRQQMGKLEFIKEHIA